MALLKSDHPRFSASCSSTCIRGRHGSLHELNPRDVRGDTAFRHCIKTLQASYINRCVIEHVSLQILIACPARAWTGAPFSYNLQSYRLEQNPYPMHHPHHHCLVGKKPKWADSELTYQLGMLINDRKGRHIFLSSNCSPPENPDGVTSRQCDWSRLRWCWHLFRFSGFRLLRWIGSVR